MRKLFKTLSFFLYSLPVGIVLSLLIYILALLIGLTTFSVSNAQSFLSYVYLWTQFGAD